MNIYVIFSLVAIGLLIAAFEQYLASNPINAVFFLLWIVVMYLGQIAYQIQKLYKKHY